MDYIKHFRKITDRKPNQSRPVLQYINFTDKFIGATDSHSLLIIPNKTGIIGKLNPKTLQPIEVNYPPLEKIIPDDDPMNQVNVTIEQIKVANALAKAELNKDYVIPNDWTTFDADMLFNAKKFIDMCSFLIDYMKENKSAVINVQTDKPFKLLKVTPDLTTTDNDFSYILAPIRKM
jgi:hypothetical protein